MYALTMNFRTRQKRTEHQDDADASFFNLQSSVLTTTKKTPKTFAWGMKNALFGR